MPASELPPESGGSETMRATLGTREPAGKRCEPQKPRRAKCNIQGRLTVLGVPGDQVCQADAAGPIAGTEQNPEGAGWAGLGTVCRPNPEPTRGRAPGHKGH